jgi:glycogen debranching enzyme
LIGPYAFAHLRVYDDPLEVRRLIGPLTGYLITHGTVTECAEGDPPHDPRAAIAQAWSVAELLRVSRRLEAVVH